MESWPPTGRHRSRASAMRSARCPVRPSKRWPPRPRDPDGRHAVEVGARGVIVSNHGGRQLDYAVASLDALPEVVQAVGREVPVLMDGGVRRGTDVLKALCLGAQGVLIGRPFLYALAVGGADGVSQMLAMLRQEIELSMSLLGVRRLHELTEDFLTRV